MILQFVNWKTGKGLFVVASKVTHVTSYYMPSAKPEDKSVGTEIGLIGGVSVIVTETIGDVINELQEAGT